METRPDAATSMISTAGMLLRSDRKDELIERMSPERRAILDRIRRLREQMGKAPFDIVQELRELRNHG
jgi:hypothetical protein